MSERVPASIDEARCCGCTQCRLVCLAGAIVPLTARCRVEEERCTGCGKCLGVCPLRCISLNFGVPNPESQIGSRPAAR